MGTDVSIILGRSFSIHRPSISATRTHIGDFRRLWRYSCFIIPMIILSDKNILAGRSPCATPQPRPSRLLQQRQSRPLRPISLGPTHSQRRRPSSATLPPTRPAPTFPKSSRSTSSRRRHSLTGRSYSLCTRIRQRLDAIVAALMHHSGRSAPMCAMPVSRAVCASCRTPVAPVVTGPAVSEAELDMSSDPAYGGVNKVCRCSTG